MSDPDIELLELLREKSLDRAKLGIFKRPNSVFLSTILFSLNIHWDNVGTACTNGLFVKLDPVFWDKLNPSQQVFLLAHEAWHVAFQHMLRMHDRDPKQWNHAADYVINHMLIEEGLDMPPGGLHDPRYANLSAEQVYDLLDGQMQYEPDNGIGDDLQDPDQTDDGSGNNSGDGDGHSNPSGIKNSDRVADILIKAAAQSKMSGDKAGTIPGDVEVYLDKLLHPRLPWQTILKNFVCDYQHDDYSYRRPNRHYLHTDFYLPSLYNESVGQLGIAIDASGSVNQTEFDAFLTEVVGIQEIINPSSTTVVDFDTKIHTIHHLTAEDDVTALKFQGRGGTSLTPVFEYFDKHPPIVLIVFSDLECRAIKQKPVYPVIWVKTPGSGHNPSFGKLVKLDPYEED